MHILLRLCPVVCLILVSTGIGGCNSAEPTSANTPTPIVIEQRVEVPVTVTSPQIVEKQVVVTATPSQPVPCHPNTVADSEEIVIGALAPLTGRFAAGGLTMQAGINIAVEKINSEGGVQGKPLRLITYDTASNPEIGNERTQQLITQDCAVGVVGIYDSEVGLAVKDTLHQFSIPGIFVDTYNDQITTDQMPEVFRIAPSMTIFAEMAAQWLLQVGDFNNDGQTFAVIVAEDAPYGQLQTEQTVRWFDEGKIQHNELFVDLPTNDFSPVIARIVDMDTTPDAIFIRISGDSSLMLVKQLVQNGIGPRKKTLIVAGSSALDESKFWQTLGADGTFIVATRIGPWPSTVSEEGQNFAERYLQYNAQWPTNAAFGGYDAVRLLTNAIQNSPTLQSSDLIAALENSQITLAAGDYSFPVNKTNPPSEGTRPYLWHQWQNVPLLFLQYTEPLQASADMAVIWPEIYRTSNGPIVLPEQ